MWKQCRTIFRFHLFLALGVVCAALSGHVSVCAQQTYGAVAEEGIPNRKQDWRVPSGVPSTHSRAALYRPPGAGPFPLALIAHASTQNALRRAQLPAPDYRGLAHALVARGFAVLVPERSGHGATGGPYAEDQGGCADADYVRAGIATAHSIAAAYDYMRKQKFIRPKGAWILGHSAGGWGALAFAAMKPSGVARIIVFAPGRGGHADDVPLKVCAPERLIDAARGFGHEAGGSGAVPVTWLVAANDSYFPPAFSREMANAFSAGGDKVDFRVMPAFGDEGHWLAETARDLELLLPP